MEKHNDADERRTMADSVFWQAATVAMPLAAAAAVLIFALVVAVADGVSPSLDPSPHLVFAVVLVAMTVVAASLAWRKTSRSLGAAVGIVVAGLLVAFVWLVTA